MAAGEGEQAMAAGEITVGAVQSGSRHRHRLQKPAHDLDSLHSVY